VDPVVAAAHVITALQTLVSRVANPFKELVVSVTQVHAGSAFNIIPESATLNGTLRTFDDEIWNALPARFEKIVRGVGEALGVQVDLRFERHNRATVNDPAMAAMARETAARIVGADNVLDDLKTMGGEDFSWFLSRVPGCFIAIGSRNESRGLTFGHHHPRFDVDESCLEIGAEVLLATARAYLAR
jgi:amidohydrolase